MKVLFVCTGNYYRSRLAEELLRWYSLEMGLTVECDSAALGIVPNPINIGPIRKEALEYIEKQGIRSDSVGRFPKKCTSSDLNSSDIVVCMNMPEHKTMFEGQFGALDLRYVRYWRVPDMDEDPDGIGPSLMEKNVLDLLKEIEGKSAVERGAIPHVA